MIAVLVLLYGDHEDLARRCLEPLLAARSPELDEIRVGLNTIGPGTRTYLRELCQAGRLDPQQLHDAGRNIHKYPMCRWLLQSVTSDYVMWFDDDSYVLQPQGFFPACLQQLGAADMLGSMRYTQRLVGAQAQWLKAQPWCPPAARSQPITSVRFHTGGWWLVRRTLLQRFNYPWPELDHRGGDHMWGACLTLNNVPTRCQSPALVAINADAAGRESRSRRRGFDQPPIGANYTGVLLPALALPERRVPFDAGQPLPPRTLFDIYE